MDHACPSPLALFPNPLQNITQFSAPEVQAQGAALLEAALLSYSKLDDALLNAMQVMRKHVGR